MGSGLGYTGHIHKQFIFTKYVSQNIYTTCTKLNRSSRPDFLCGKSGENFFFYRYYRHCTKHNHANQDLFSSVSVIK